MNIHETYHYPIRARRDLFDALQSAPDEVLSRPLPSGSAFQCIKDLLFHLVAVEDGWIHEDILRVDPVLLGNPGLKDTTAYEDSLWPRCSTIGRR